MHVYRVYTRRKYEIRQKNTTKDTTRDSLTGRACTETKHLKSGLVHYIYPILYHVLVPNLVRNCYTKFCVQWLIQAIIGGFKQIPLISHKRSPCKIFFTLS